MDNVRRLSAERVENSIGCILVSLKCITRNISESRTTDADHKQYRQTENPAHNVC